MAKRKKNKTNLSGVNPSKAVKPLIFGRLLSLDFFKRNFVYIIALTIMTLMYISNKYVCQNSTKEVMQLKKQLIDAQTDRVNASARYNSQICESEMQRLVDSMNINLSAPEQPPYTLTSAK